MSEETIEEVWESRLALEREVARVSTENEHLRNRLREMQEHSTEQLEEIRATKKALSVALVRAENAEEKLWVSEHGLGPRGGTPESLTKLGLQYILDAVLRQRPSDDLRDLAEHLVEAIRALGG